MLYIGIFHDLEKLKNAQVPEHYKQALFNKV